MTFSLEGEWTITMRVALLVWVCVGLGLNGLGPSRDGGPRDRCIEQQELVKMKRSMTTHNNPFGDCRNGNTRFVSGV